MTLVPRRTASKVLKAGKLQQASGTLYLHNGSTAGGVAYGSGGGLFDDVTDGTVPASGGGTSNFLRADGTWAAPPGGSGGNSYFPGGW
jgi:hypothetical protein